MKAIVFSMVLICFSAIYSNCLENTCGSCLLLTHYIRNGSATKARELSVVNPTQFQGIRSYSGYVTVKEEYKSNLFFWFFPVSELEMKNKPWIIWLQGGPGFSSLMGLFELIGPLKIENGKVELRNVTWASDYSLLFLDNPVGAGFSFTADERGYPDNENDVGGQMYEFLLQFLQMFPELREAPLFIAGQSYAGKYVPALGIQIHRHKSRDGINLKGLSIGNGMIDLRSMMHYSDLCSALGLLEDEQLAELKVLEESVVHLIDSKAMVDASNKFNETIEYIKKHSGISVYNFDKDPDSSRLEFEDFLNRGEVREWIHAGNASFDLNNQHVYAKMLPDIANTTKPWVEELLEHYAVMSYSGQLDIILPYSLSKHTYEQLQWSKRQEYVKAPRKRLRRHANGSIVGYKKAGGNFVEVLVRRAGHAVPKDQPEVAKFIIDLFIEKYK